MKMLFGEKLHMTQVFDASGNVVPVTLVRALPNVVLGVRTKEKDGYQAVQVGFGVKKEKKIRKPEKGHFKDLGMFRHVREFRTSDQFERGAKLDVAQFSEGDTIKISGISKSKGFQGVVKRHGFHGAPATHGTKHAHREPGSIGGGGGRAGGRVVKGMKMAGRMGGERVSVRNLKIVKVDSDNNVIAVLGAIPGRRGTLVEIRG
ncbi:MAG: 50S ribosomal protein L3 [Candidatus Sungbacteria bacterium RIFCSPHIGHO2_01_FULL_50_25]|uniref:Large ribosomal subunit protein uL3 n=1 Tax=Candidatus Sungbacteria bacterium RIFCSPHIGHO2_01_FULL_50_25 TaxID=1802265 RepID=A0A1G2KAP0_9BACT|nr:MAG: 50S ribosomal protein L3 [Candidatus Sungbacteria bacterium RIFCSPHIGHO2_01_FULL_50_25]